MSDQPQRNPLKRPLRYDFESSSDDESPNSIVCVILGVQGLIPNYRPISWHCRVEGCGKFFTGNKDRLVEHHRSEHKLEQYQCLLEGCGKTRDVKADLMAHIQFEHSNVGANEWKCCECDFLPYDTYQELKCHHKLYHEKGEFGCVVKGCGYETKLLLMMDNHYKAKHEGKNEFVCTFKGCITVLDDEKALWQHVSKDHLQKNPFKCVFGDGQCNFRHKDLATARAHVKAAHLKGGQKLNPTTEFQDKYIRLVTKTGKLVQRTMAIE